MFGVAANGNKNQSTNEKDGGLAAFITQFHHINILCDGTLNHSHYLGFSTVAPNNDVFTSKILNLNEIKDFESDMLKEIEEAN